MSPPSHHHLEPGRPRRRPGAHPARRLGALLAVIVLSLVAESAVLALAVTRPEGARASGPFTASPPTPATTVAPAPDGPTTTATPTPGAPTPPPVPEPPPATLELQPLGRWTHTYGSFDRRATHETFSGTAVGDITGDGHPEVVAGAPDGHVRAWTVEGTLVLAHRVGNGAVHATPVLVDIDGDGVLDVLSASLSGDIVGVTAAGRRVFHVRDTGPVSPIRGVFPTPAIGDLDGDGGLEVVATSWDHYVHAWRLDGSRLPGFPVFVYDTIWSSPTLADLDGDNRNEIVFGGDMDEYPGAPYPKGGLVWALTATGGRLPGFPRSLPGQVIWSSPAVVDLDGNGALDIVVGTGLNWPSPAGQEVHALDRTGAHLPGWPVTVTGRVMGSPAVADITGDGSLEVATLADDGHLSVHDRTGRTLWQACTVSDDDGDCRSGVGAHGQVAVADLDADGVQDIVTATGQSLRVYGGADGELLATRPMPGVWSPPVAPTIVEIDGRAVITVNTTVKARGDGRPGPGDQQVVWVWTTGRSLGRADWPTFKQNQRRSGTWGDDTTPDARFVAAPPATGAATALEWAADDPGSFPSGIAHFDLDVREDGGPWQRWLSGTRRDGATLHLRPGTVTLVRVRAVDRAGNVGRWSAPVPVTAHAGDRSRPFGAAYAVSSHGELSSVSSPPATHPRWSWAAARDLAANPAGSGGWVLDAYGGLSPFGGAPELAVSAYWRGWDVARAVAVDHRGRSGYVLDASGGLHPVGDAVPVRPSGWWSGQDVAVDVVLLPGSTAREPAGYVLDAFGGLHAFGGAPARRGSAYWPGARLARAIAANPDGAGGWVLDAAGAIHAFGGAPEVTGAPYWAGRDLARDLAPLTATSGYVLDELGTVHPYGGAPAVEPSRWWPAGGARRLSLV